MYRLTIINLPSGETESIEFGTYILALDFWADRAIDLTRKGWSYDYTITEDVLSRFTYNNKSITAYLGESHER